MPAPSKVLYKPLSLFTSVLGGILAGLVFRQIWSRVGDDRDTPPQPKDLGEDIREVLIAAALQGAIFGLVKAAVDRAGAQGYRALTHENPE
jgi:hypothetical protein